MNVKRFWQVTCAVLIMASLGLGVVFGAQYFAKPMPLMSLQLLPSPKKIPELQLENHRGAVFTGSEFYGRWSLVFFGFTSCPDFCPLELQKLAKLMREINRGDQLQVVFVTVDPERDVTEKLADYVGFFHAQILGVRGSNGELAKLAQFFGASYDRSAILDSKLLTIPAGINLPDNVSDGYRVNHSTRVFVVNGKSEFVGSFAQPFEMEEMQADIINLIER